MGRRIGKPQTPTKAGYSDVFDIRQHQKYVKDNILANPKDDALGSVRCGTGNYLISQFGAPTNNNIWTFSVWLKPSSLSTSFTPIMEAYTGSTDQYCTIALNSNKIRLVQDEGSGGVISQDSLSILRDSNSWYHVVVLFDNTSSSTLPELHKIFINGIDRTSTNTTIASETPYINKSGAYVKISGRWTGTAAFDGYLSQINFIDGLALDSTYFGYTDRETGQWKPKRYTGAFGTNGFYLPMETAPAIDESGNDNHFTAHNITYNDNPLNDSDFIPVTTVVKLTSSETPFTDYVENLSSGTTEASIEFWIKMDGSYNGISGLFNFIFPATDLHLDYYNNTGQGFRLVEGSGTGIPFNYFYKTNVSTTTSLLYDGNWHHVCFTFESLSGLNSSGTLNVQGYLDGTLMTGTASSGTGNYADKNFPAIGRGNGYTDTDITEIRKFRIYPKQLSSSQVTTLYNQTESIAHSSFNLRTETYLNNSNDTVPDSPQNTFATLNPLDFITNSTATLTGGNLKVQQTNAQYGGFRSTLSIPKTGKYYVECYLLSSVGAGDNQHFGIMDYESNKRFFYDFYYTGSGLLNIDGTTSTPSTGALSAGTIIAILIDADNGTANFYINNSILSPTYSLTHDVDYFIFFNGYESGVSVYNFGQDHTFDGGKSALATPYTDANGIGEFYYPPPDGAFALCTKNLEGGLGNATTTKKYYNRDETGKVLSYEGYNDYTYGTINDERFSDLSPYSGTSTKSVFFDGTNDIIRFQDDTKTSLIFLHDGSPYTVEFAIQVLTTPPSTRNHIIGTTQPSSTNIGLGIYLSDDLTFRIYTVSGISGASQYIDSTSSLNLGVWHNVALTYDGNSGNGGTNTFALYIDGTDVASSLTYQNGSSFNHSSSNANRMLTFASDNNDTNFWHGRLTNVRISNVVRSGLTSVPTENLSSDSNTKILFQPYNTETVNNTTPMYPRDEVGKVLDYNGSVSFVNVSPYADNSVKSFDFDGTDGCYITVKDTSTIDFGTSDFTIEMWVLINTLVTDNYFINWSSTGGNNTHSGINLYAGAWRVGAFDDYLLTGTLTTGVSANEWKHLAMVRYSNTLYFYVDGVSIGTPETVTGVNFSSDDSEGFRLASYINDATKNPNCFMSDVRIVKGTAVYTGAFTPPSGKLTTTGGTYPSTTNVNTSITAGHTTFLAQPYSQPAQIHDVGSTYRTNQIYLTDETGNNLTYV